MAYANLADPFAPVELTVEYVDSAAGSGKTLSAVALALEDAKRGQSTIFAMPTLELIREMVEFARRDGRVPVYEITSANRAAQNAPIEQLIGNHLCQVGPGHLLFITHEGLHRVVDWPPQAAGFHLVIDEAPEVILSRKPFKLRDSHWVLTSFLDVAPVPTTIAEGNNRAMGPPEFTYPIPGSNKKTDQDRLDTCVMILEAASNASQAEIAMALKEGKRLLAKKEAWENWLSQRGQADRDIAAAYYLIIPKISSTANDPLSWLKRREKAKPQDDIYEYLDPIAMWLLQGNALFTDMAAWNKVTIKSNDPKVYNDFRRGLITITGLRRPDAFQSFQRITVMSALFQHTMTYAVWGRLGVRLVPSSWVRMSVPASPLGSRRLRIYWLSEQGWSKKTRDKSGGIAKVLEFINAPGVLDPNAPVCVVVNKDDGSEANPTVVTDVFPTAVVMPHNVRGQNRWRHFHQLVHCAALNAYTPDIRWLEGALGIDATTQRIARTGAEIYQALMRTSLRDPTAKNDVTLVVMDRDVAGWLPQWFVPRDQVEVCGIDASAVIRRTLPTGRPAIGDRAMTAAERQRRRRQRRDQSDQAIEP